MAKGVARTFPEIDALVARGVRPFDGVKAVMYENHCAAEVEVKLERRGELLFIKVLPGRTPSGLIVGAQ